MIIKNKLSLIFGIIDISLGATATILTFVFGESVVYRLIISLVLIAVGILNIMSGGIKVNKTEMFDELKEKTENDD